MDRPRLCVLCHARPVEPRWRPFCSHRCQTLDQARWADGAYRVETPSSRLPDPDEPAPDDDDG